MEGPDEMHEITLIMLALGQLAPHRPIPEPIMEAVRQDNWPEVLRLFRIEYALVRRSN